MPYSLPTKNVVDLIAAIEAKGSDAAMVSLFQPSSREVWEIGAALRERLAYLMTPQPTHPYESGLLRLTERIKTLALRQGGYHSAWGWICKCWWCQGWFPLERMTREHLIRKADGGSNADDNIRIACKPCNHGREHDPDSPKYRPESYVI